MASPLRNDYLIWSNEHRMWWRADERGYTKSIAQAGIYCRDAAIEIVTGASRGQWLKEPPNELAVCVDDLPFDAREILHRA